MLLKSQTKKKVMSLRVYFTLVACLYSMLLLSQDLPPIQNYSPSECEAENQNWSITQSPDKLVYIANNKGLLEFNGAKWKLYPTPNETIMRSVKAIGEKIYTGSYLDFGYWEKNNYGVLSYTSLSKEIGITLVEDEQFWNIISIDDWVLFQSLDRIFIYNSVDRSVKTIDSKKEIRKMYKVGNSAYFQRLGDGIYKIENGKDILISDNELVKQNAVVNIFLKEADLLIQTMDEGFHILNDEGLKKWDIDANELLSTVSVYNSIRLKDDGFMLGTISNGLVYLDDDGNVQFQIKKTDGLLNNTVLSLFEDAGNNIWLGLDYGVSNINMKSPIRVYNDYKGDIGSVYTSAIYEDKLYLGSNQGLFYKELKSDDSFKLVEGTKGQVWKLKLFDQTLFCGHNSGTFLIHDDIATKISSIEGAWDIKPLKQNGLLLQGNYDGLYILEQKNGSWGVRNKIAGFDNSARYFVEMPENEIFINHEYKGVFKVKVNPNYTKALDVSIDSLIKGANSCIIKYRGDLLYSYKKGIFKYDISDKKFIKDSLLSSMYADESEFISGNLALNEKTDNLWGFSNSSIHLMSPGELTSSPKFTKIPLSLAQRKEVVGYESAMLLNDANIYLLGSNSGYITVDVSRLDVKDFEIKINSVVNGKRNGGGSVLLLDKDEKGVFESGENTLEISFYVPEYSKYQSQQYQYQLAGIYDEWSDWSSNSVELFENLPYGDYTFNARAKIGDKISDNVASYPFEIAKPWYATNLMKALYIIGTVLFLLLMHYIYRRYYKKQQQKLIDKNNRERKLEQVENEKEIIRIKNERLQIEFKNKSKELAASTMGIIKKNELLTTIKNELNAIKDKSQVKPVVNIIDKSLKQNDDWEFFKEAFNNADSEFLKNLKSSHPSLSPNDLKLCAYLRLNLSSKEIAPLLNISPRSVEIKRYRLRKKLNLSHEDNLVNYIIGL